jgi:hypothetical protein
MAATQKVSDTSIYRIWRAHRLQPHRVEKFKASQDPEFVDKVRDIVGLYRNPPENTLVFSVDEKSQIQALDRTLSRFCHCAKACQKGRRTTTAAMLRQHYLQP